MATSVITLPQLGETVEEAVIVKWFKGVGDHVDRGETLLEAETDKITVEVPALMAGVIVELVAAEGVTVPVGGVIARLREDTAGAEPPSPLRQPPSGGAAPESTRSAGAESDAAATSSAPAQAVAVPTPTVNKLRASPAARRAARDLGIDLAGLRDTGTGPSGRITKADVLAFAAPPAVTVGAREVTRAAIPSPASYADALPPRDEGHHAFTRIEQVSARLTQRSFQEIPHFYVKLTCDVTDLMKTLRALPETRKVSLNDVLVKATALALQSHRRLNASLVEGGLALHQQVHIGVITATDEGVITSVVPDADAASLAEIRQRVRDVRGRLKAGRAQASDVTGATFCISNMGMYGVDEFSAIILPPNVAILAVGALKEEVLVDHGLMRVAQTITLTVSADHRALDGVAVALFLRGVQGLLAQPAGWVV